LKRKEESMLACLLNTICTVRRKTSGAANALGEAAQTWSDLYTGVRCRVEGVSGQSDVEITSGKQVVAADWRVWFGPLADVTEKDRIVWCGRTFEVGLVRRYAGGCADHLETYCVEVRV
jgi:head-tail adaptor